MHVTGWNFLEGVYRRYVLLVCFFNLLFFAFSPHLFFFGLLLNNWHYSYINSGLHTSGCYYIRKMSFCLVIPAPLPPS